MIEKRPARGRRPQALGHAFLMALVLLGTTAAFAQAGTHDLARRLVSEGIEAAKSNDWETARLQFEKAYEVKPVPQTLYNLAAAQEKTGLLVEADRSYRLYLRETEVGGNTQFRTLAAGRRDDLVRRIGHITINVENLGPDDTLLVNEKEVSIAVVGESVPVNPGWTKVLVQRAGVDVATQHIELGEGASQILELAAPKYIPPTITPKPVPASAANSSEPGAGSGASLAENEAEDDGGGLLVPVLIGAGAVVVVGVLVAAGAGVGTAMFLIPTDPTQTSLDPVTINGR